MNQVAVEDAFRHHYARVLAGLARAFGKDRLDLCEDAAQEALVRALRQWPIKGVPDDPGAWLLRVAHRAAIDHLRRKKHDVDVDDVDHIATDHDADAAVARLDAHDLTDDQLRMMFLCAHPALPTAQQLALTLKIVCGFGTREIAGALLASESNVLQRITRAKQRLREPDVRFEMPPAASLRERLDAVLRVLYLLFTEGYSPHDGDAPLRRDLIDDAIRLTGMLADNAVTSSPRVFALRALMRLQSSRLAARVDGDGELVPLSQQDRTRWDRARIAEGLADLERVQGDAQADPYALQAAIAGAHVIARDAGDTNWALIVELYDMLERVVPSPVVALNRAVAIGMRDGPVAGVAALDAVAVETRASAPHLLSAARAECLARANQPAEAAVHYRAAAASARVPAERRYFIARARELDPAGADALRSTAHHGAVDDPQAQPDHSATGAALPADWA